MKKFVYILIFSAVLISCSQQDFEDAYTDPGKLSSTSIDRQFTGFLYMNREYVLPAYWNYFVVLRTSLNHYMQITGWANETGQYVPPSSGTEAVWFNYYATLFQYRELEKIYNNASETDQADKKIFMLAAKVYLYDYTQRMVDLFGAIPFTNAGMLSQNSGDYQSSLAEFDQPDAVYTLMLDDLKTIAAELNSIELNSTFQLAFTTQDYVNNGDIDSWKRYCNSLRLRMLNRVQDASAFTSRASSEMGEILGDPSTYPIVEDNDQNIQINVYDLSSAINSKGFQSALESGSGWFVNTAGKAIIDQMVDSNDPRLPYIFEPGESAGGVYEGIDQLADANTATQMANNGLVAIFNTSTYARNQYFPGIIINAAEVDLIKAEYYLKAGSDGMAKSSYEDAIAESVDQYVRIRDVSNDASVPAPSVPTSGEIDAYTAGDMISWDNATTTDEKLKLIATQKWVHFNIIQGYENWAEFRRMRNIDLEFEADNGSIQTLPPVRFNIPANEITYNGDNYDAVASDDDLNNKMFWDTK